MEMRMFGMLNPKYAAFVCGPTGRHRLTRMTALCIQVGVSFIDSRDAAAV